MLNDIYAECHKLALNAEGRYAEGRVAQCRYAECRGSVSLSCLNRKHDMRLKNIV